MTYDELVNTPRFQLFDIVILKSWAKMCAEYPDNIDLSCSQFKAEAIVFDPYHINKEVCSKGFNLELIVTEITYDPDNPQDGIAYEVSYINRHNELKVLDDSSYFTYEMFVAPKIIKSKTKKRKKIKKSMCNSTKFKKENI